MFIRSLCKAIGIAACSLITSAFAADPNATPGIDQRMENQQRRIDQGIESGRLTPREANRLDKRQDKIQNDVDQAQADGTVTRAERRRLHRELDRSSGAVARQKHDRQHDYDRDAKVDRPRR